MTEPTPPHAWQSLLGPLIAQFIQEKQACGYTYVTEQGILRRLDRFLGAHGLAQIALPRSLVEPWIAKHAHESARTHRTRVGLLRRLAIFVARHGYPAYIPPSHLVPREPPSFTPYILSSTEVHCLLDAADRLRPTGHAPLRHLILPELFRVLYSCGLRVSEALRLRRGDVDLEVGVLTIRQGKFRKDRMVPLTPALTQRLHHYAHTVGRQTPDAIFFPAPHGGPYHRETIYKAFRQLLWACRIPHGGRGHGPRLHDLRHTYAVHRLAQWYRAGADLQAYLPVLATYMGHLSVLETQCYLRLTADVFPDLSARCDAAFGYIIPQRTSHATDGPSQVSHSLLHPVSPRAT
jgi:integrase/recombinase XerD